MKRYKSWELTQFIKDLRDKLDLRGDREQGTEKGERYLGEVKTISGGSILNGDNKTARKKDAQQVYNLYQFNSA